MDLEITNLKKSAFNFLQRFMIKIGEIEYSRNENNNWIHDAIPYIIGEKKLDIIINCQSETNSNM